MGKVSTLLDFLTLHYKILSIFCLLLINFSQKALKGKRTLLET